MPKFNKNNDLTPKPLIYIEFNDESTMVAAHPDYIIMINDVKVDILEMFAFIMAHGASYFSIPDVPGRLTLDVSPLFADPEYKMELKWK